MSNCLNKAIVSYLNRPNKAIRVNEIVLLRCAVDRVESLQPGRFRATWAARIEAYVPRVKHEENVRVAPEPPEVTSSTLVYNGDAHSRKRRCLK